MLFPSTVSIAFWLVCCAMIVLGSSRGAAQTPQVQNWTTEEGLPQNSVHSLLQTRDGYLWLATENGAARFDGLRFRRYSSVNEPAFASDDLCCIAENASGQVFFGTASGVVTMRDGLFRRLPDVSGEVVSLAAEATGDVLVLTAAGLQRVHDSAVSSVAFANGAVPTALAQGVDGSVLALAGTVLFRVQGAAVATLGSLPKGALQIAEDRAHQIWVADTSGVERLDARLQVAHRWQTNRELPGSRIEFVQPWEGGVLVGTNRGAVRLGSREDTVQPLPSLANNAVLSAMLDREGDAWFGTDSSGLFGLRERSIASVSALAGESVTALATAEDGRLWAGTRDAGLREFTASKSEQMASSQRLSSDVVLSLALDPSGL